MTVMEVIDVPYLFLALDLAHLEARAGLWC
jgi:hypothetical protein